MEERHGVDDCPCREGSRGEKDFNCANQRKSHVTCRPACLESGNGRQARHEAKKCKKYSKAKDKFLDSGIYGHDGYHLMSNCPIKDKKNEEHVNQWTELKYKQVKINQVSKEISAVAKATNPGTTRPKSTSSGSLNSVASQAKAISGTLGTSSSLARQSPAFPAFTRTQR